MALKNDRLTRHLGIGLGSLVTVGFVALLRGQGLLLDTVSVVTAYLSLALLIAALAIGPLQARRTGKGILNSHQRRDLGIWVAILGLIHFCGRNRAVHDSGFTWEPLHPMVFAGRHFPGAASRDSSW